jgi:hypothetical protein
MQMEMSRMLCPINEEIENDYEQDVESEVAQASAQFKEAVDDDVPPDLVDSASECESVVDELDADGEMERPLDAPVRLPEVPVQRFSSEILVRAKALGNRLPPLRLSGTPAKWREADCPVCGPQDGVCANQACVQHGGDRERFQQYHYGGAVA